MRQTRTRGRVQTPGMTPSVPNQWKLDVHVKSSKFKSCQREIATHEIQQQKKKIESAAI